MLHDKLTKSVDVSIALSDNQVIVLACRDESEPILVMAVLVMVRGNKFYWLKLVSFLSVNNSNRLLLAEVP